MGQLLLRDEQVVYVGDPAAEDAQNDDAYGYGTPSCTSAESALRGRLGFRVHAARWSQNYNRQSRPDEDESEPNQ